MFDFEGNDKQFAARQLDDGQWAVLHRENGVISLFPSEASAKHAAMHGNLARTDEEGRELVQFYAGADADQAARRTNR